jgi:adenylosuccinate lyase
MMELARKGYGRQRGHEAVRRAAMRAHDEGLSMKESLLRDDEITDWLDEDELDALLDPDAYTGTSVERVEEVVERLS